jgi:hypothetical protein
VIFLTSKLITRFIDNFSLGMKSQSIANLLRGSERLYWILDLEGEKCTRYGFVDNMPSRMQGQFPLEVRRGMQ